MIEPFQNEVIWSNCCSALVIDPGNTGEWICSECGEHCSIVSIREFDLAMLDAKLWQAHIFRLSYDPGVEDMYEAARRYFEYEGIDLTDIEYICFEDSPIIAKDHRKRLKTVANNV